MCNPQSIPVICPTYGCSTVCLIMADYALISLALTGNWELPKAKWTDFESACCDVDNLVALVGFNI